MQAREDLSSPLASSRSEKLEDADKNLARMIEACRTILECIGEDPTREGLLKTPSRMAKALLSNTAGYAGKASEIINDALFSCESEEMVMVHNITMYSTCEHHILPFYGTATVAYLPQGRVLGLSKVARLVDLFSKRLQIQERLTSQIAEAVQDATGAAGVAVQIEAQHMCMSMRGVEKCNSNTMTEAFTGVFKSDRGLRHEFILKTIAAKSGAGGNPAAAIASASREASESITSEGGKSSLLDGLVIRRHAEAASEASSSASSNSSASAAPKPAAAESAAHLI